MSLACSPLCEVCTCTGCPHQQPTCAEKSTRRLSIVLWDWIFFLWHELDTQTLKMKWIVLNFSERTWAEVDCLWVLAGPGDNHRNWKSESEESGEQKYIFVWRKVIKRDSHWKVRLWWRAILGRPLVYHRLLDCHHLHNPIILLISKAEDFPFCNPHSRHIPRRTQLIQNYYKSHNWIIHCDLTTLSSSYWWWQPLTQPRVQEYMRQLPATKVQNHCQCQHFQ